MLKMLSKEEKLVEMVSSCEEELSEDFMDLVESEVEENCDLYIVKEEGEYKDWYVLMCYDYGDSLCEIEVSKNRGDLVQYSKVKQFGCNSKKERCRDDKI